jgi:hypothetical protein
MSATASAAYLMLFPKSVFVLDFFMQSPQVQSSDASRSITAGYALRAYATLKAISYEPWQIGSAGLLLQGK